MIKLNFKSIMVKILVLVALAGFMQGIFLINISYSMSKNTLLRQINESGLKCVEAHTDTMGVWFKGKLNEFHIYANSQVIKTMDWTQIESYLRKEISTKLDIYDHMFVADTAGNYSTTLKRNAGNIADRSYFAPVMQGQAVISEPIISRTTGNQMSVIAVPVKDDKGQVIGLVGGSLNLVKLNNFIANSNVDHADSYSYIIDKAGMIITHPNKNLIMKENISVPSESVEDSLVIASKEILKYNKGFVEYAHNDASSLNYYNIIPHTDGWKLVTKIPIEYLYAPLYNTNKSLIFIGIIGLIISVISAAFVARTISRPIVRLKDVFTRAASGDLTVRATQDSNDEVGQAARNFNRMMETISDLTFNDTLTGLPNKLQFIDRMNHELLDCVRNNERLSVIIFDIDKFENINNAMGHSIGDKLLKSVGEQIKLLLNENEIACRLGEDRFALLLPNSPQETHVIRIAQKLLEMIKQPWSISEHRFYITASVGITFYPDDGNDAEALLKNTLSAMFRAKKMGRDNYQLYDAKVSSKLLDRIELDNHMHHALDNNEFVLNYQPQVDIATGKIIGAEALIRWKHPQQGMIPPIKFIPLAEENGFIVPIGDWVLRTACMQSKKWADMGFDPIYVSVNISALQMQQNDFIEKVAKVIKETGIDPEYLELEITESIAMEGTASILKILETLKGMGLRIALDDFGTGYSSLNYLRKFQITTLKIDQSFTREITTDSKDAAIVSTILAIGRNLNLKVTAEGVETTEQLDFLRENNCDIMQGYLYSKPLSCEDFEELLKNPPRI